MYPTSCPSGDASEDDFEGVSGSDDEDDVSDQEDEDQDLSGEDDEEEEPGVGLDGRRAARAAGDHPLQSSFRAASAALLQK